MAKLKVTLGEESWIYDTDATTLKDLFAIKSATGLNGTAFNGGIEKMEPQALQGFVWFLRYKAGVQPNDPTQIDFVLSDLKSELIEEPESDDDQDPKDEPTP